MIISKRKLNELLEENKNNSSMYYKLGIENYDGSLLNTMEFETDKELFDEIYKIINKYVKSGDLQNPRFIIQVYYKNECKSFDNCICQFFLTENQLN